MTIDLGKRLVIATHNKGKLAEFEDFLNGTLRSVGRGRHQLRTAAGTHDYAAR